MHVGVLGRCLPLGVMYFVAFNEHVYKYANLHFSTMEPLLLQEDATFDT